MEKNHSNVYDKMFGKTVVSENISVEGLKEKVKVDIRDGMAIGTTKSGKVVMLEYPKLSVIKSSKELGDELMGYLSDITTIDEVTPVQVMQTFATIYVDGVELKKH